MGFSKLAVTAVFCLCGVGVGAGCIPPQNQAERLTNAAYEVVMAARFGRMDVVVSIVRASEREAFAEAHAEWGGRVRILDIEYGGANMLDSERAVVAMSVSWQRLDESFLRTTSLKQDWARGENGWEIVSEEVVSGDRALLRAPEPKPTRDDAKPGRDDPDHPAQAAREVTLAR